jgi:hypothetical protein
MRIFLIAISAILLGSAGTTSADAQIPAFTVLNGRCDAKSHIAKGPVEADLREYQLPYSCDSAVISVNASNGRVMLQFADRRSNGQLPIGFAGRLEVPYLLKVERVYVKPGQALRPQEAYCRLWNGEAQPGTLLGFTAVLCFAQIDEGGRRTVAFILFRVK